jgi:hypothetical protein
MQKIDTITGHDDEFTALPLVADYIKVNGECLAVMLISGYIPVYLLGGIFVALLGQHDPILQSILSSMLPEPLVGGNFFILIGGSIGFAVAAFLCLLLSKFIAELIMSVGAIANNTKKAANKSEK